MSIRNCNTCSATTKSGIRCKRRTCITWPYCWQHTKSHYKLRIKKSGIPAAGLGLFTLQNIRRNTKIADYTGVQKSLQEYAINNSGYGVQVNNNTIIDAERTQSAVGRYANRCKAENRNNGHCNGNNAKITIDRRYQPARIALKSTRNIAAGSEIFTAYGNSYS